MGNLFAFLKRNFHYIVFAFLQILAVILMYQNLNYPRFVIASAAQHITAPIFQWRYNITKHFNFERENDLLMQQNIALMREQERNFMQHSDSTGTLFDTQNGKKERLYDYSFAHVIHNTVHKKNNYLIIDRGAQDGVTIDMAVLSSQGVVGVVNNVSKHFASVISLLHPDSRVSAKVLPINQMGTIVWNEGDPETAYLQDIPQHLTVNVGDTVVTSGYSYLFPKNILIGTICESKTNSKSSFLTLKVQLATNFHHLNSVYLVKNLHKTELDSLKSSLKNE